MSLCSDNRREKRLQIEVFEKIPLQGLELEQYKRDNLREKKRQEEERLNSQVDSDSDSDDDVGAILGEDDGEENNGTDLAPNEGNISASASKAGARKLKSSKSYPMYPHSEVRTRWDDYGELINPEDFIMFDQSKKAIARDDEFARAQELDESKLAGEAAQETDEEKIPMKTVSDVKTLNIACGVTYIDFEGRSDGESLKKMIAMMKPRRVIAVHGTVAAVSSLASYCESIKSDVAFIEKVFTPKVGQIVDATTESNIYQVRRQLFALGFRNSPLTIFFAILKQSPNHFIRNFETIP